MKRRLLLLASICFVTSYVHAQSLYPVTFTEKTAKSALIIEGRVASQKSFWNEAHTLIYTTNQIEIYKVFKGTFSSSTLEIVTLGGLVETDGLVTSDLLKLSPGETGTFFLNPATAKLQSPLNRESLWDVFGSSQGFIRYDLNSGKASAPFVRYENIATELYQQIRVSTRRNFENKKPSFTVNALHRNNSREPGTLAPVITSFSPARVNAGAFLDPANNLLTINGSGFGTASGTAAVLFDDADDGAGGTPFAVDASDPLVVSWTPTQIVLRVPTEAGTGTLTVRDAANVTANAPTNLEVLYSILTYSGKETTLQNVNGSGGYTISYSTNTAGRGIDFNADPAKATFQRALNTWKENAGANIVEGANTSVQSVTFDGINTIMFDNDNTGIGPLSSGVLAVCLSWFNSCPSNPSVNQARKREFEVIIRNPTVSSGSATFTDGPCPPNSVDFNALDLETVILHELGHALNLGHIIDNYQGVSIGRINPNKLMHFAVPNSVKRTTPDYSALAGALYSITPQGAVTGSCLNGGEMTPLARSLESKDDCPASFPVSSTPPGTVVNFDLAHAGSNRFVDPAYTQIRCGSSSGAAITNNAYYVFRTQANGILSMNVTGYNTTPAALASCTPLNGAIPVTGIRMVIYQVNSCPAAGSFPTPFACRSITGNGPLSDVMSLAANSNYLIYLEGFENTKAAFSITMGGTALPIKFQSFTGTVLNEMNQLNWVIDYSYNVKTLILEKSSNGTDYSAIDSTDGNYLQQKDFYKDPRPFTGKNFYRLAVVNQDGSKEFSNIVLLTRNDKFLASVFPNPASLQLNVEVNTSANGKYNFELYSGTGQLIRKQSYQIAATRQLLHIPVTGLANGAYFLKITNSKEETVQNIHVAIKH